MNRSLTTPKGKLTIRVALSSDAARLRELRLEALSKHPESFAADYDTSARESAEDWAQRIEKYASDDNLAICVAVFEDRLVGMAGIGLGHWPRVRHAGNIWGVYVNEAWRGLHVAENLLQTCVDWAQERGAIIVKLGVVAGNISAIRCYTRCGFTVYGVEPKVIYCNGVYHDELLMAKHI